MAVGSLLRGWALAQQGQAQEGIEQIDQGLTACRATGAEIARPYFLALLAEAHGTIGEPEAGLDGARRSTDARGHNRRTLVRSQSYIASKANSCYNSLRTIRLKPKPVSSTPLAIAQNQQAKSFEFRAATSLARLWQQQGKRQEAHDLLAPVYDWFTEGFDTADLQEAKALLDALA